WLMMSLWDALRMNMMISYQELVRTFPNVAVQVPISTVVITVSPMLSVAA
ncbi:type 1 fimbrial protein, partial [Escherichia coli]